jgi:hypothetical protein
MSIQITSKNHPKFTHISLTAVGVVDRILSRFRNVCYEHLAALLGKTSSVRWRSEWEWEWAIWLAKTSSVRWRSEWEWATWLGKTSSVRWRSEWDWASSHSPSTGGVTSNSRDPSSSKRRPCFKTRKSLERKTWSWVPTGLETKALLARASSNLLLAIVCACERECVRKYEWIEGWMELMNEKTDGMNGRMGERTGRCGDRYTYA